MNGRAIGYLAILLGIVMFGLTMWIVFAPMPYIALPTVVIGVGSIVSALLITVAIAWSR